MTSYSHADSPETIITIEGDKITLHQGEATYIYPDPDDDFAGIKKVVKADIDTLRLQDHEAQANSVAPYEFVITQSAKAIVDIAAADARSERYREVNEEGVAEPD